MSLQEIIDQAFADRAMESLCVAAVAVLIGRTERHYHAAQAAFARDLDNAELRALARSAGLDYRLMASRPHGRVLPAWLSARIEEA